MQAARHPSYTIRRIDSDTLRRGQCFARRKLPGQLVRSDRDARQALGSFLNLDRKGAGVDQREAPCFTLRLGSGGMHQGDKWIMQMGREPSRAAKAMRELTSPWPNFPDSLLPTSALRSPPVVSAGAPPWPSHHAVRASPVPQRAGRRSCWREI